MRAAPGMFDATYGRGQVSALTSGPAWLEAMLEVEAALARAGAELGQVPVEAAAAIAAACRPEHFDLGAIVREGGEHATPVIGIVRELRAAVGEERAGFVHRGATSQDIVDSAAMLLARRSLAVIDADTAVAVRAAAGLARRYRDTPMVGRTLLQAALPVSFGLRAAGWAAGLDAARRDLEGIAAGLPVQLGGPVGTGSPELAALVARSLALAEPLLPWHAIRLVPARLAGALGALAGVLGKLARDVTLLAQTEVGEVSEGGGAGRGGSSAMAHKRNPVAAVSVLACSKRVPALVSTILASMEQEHERAAGAWQAEWGTLADLLSLTGSAAAWGRDLLEHLHVDAERMRANLAVLDVPGEPAGTASHHELGSSGELIDRALGGLAL